MLTHTHISTVQTDHISPEALPDDHLTGSSPDNLKSGHLCSKQTQGSRAKEYSVLNSPLCSHCRSPVYAKRLQLQRKAVCSDWRSCTAAYTRKTSEELPHEKLRPFFVGGAGGVVTCPNAAI